MVHLQLKKIKPDSIKAKKSPLCKVLLVEGDYVNYLMAGEILDKINIQYQRINSFQEAAILDEKTINIDLILISESEILSTDKQAVSYMRMAFKAPVILLVNKQPEYKVFKEWYHLFDGVILSNSDSQYYKEVVLDVLNIKNEIFQIK